MLLTDSWLLLPGSVGASNAHMVDVPPLITGLSRCIARECGLQPSAYVVRRLNNAAHTILLGLDEVILLGAPV